MTTPLSLRGALLLGALVSACGGPSGSSDDAGPATDFPEIVRFSAEPPVVLTGDRATLTWEVRDARTVSIPGLFEGGLEMSGTIETPPLDATRTFRLVAESPAGATDRNLVVTVQDGGEVRIVEFRADPPIIQSGRTELVWSTEGALSVDIRTEAGAVIQEQAVLDGRLAVTPDGSTTYVLTASGPGGPKTATARVLVGNQAFIERFEASPPQVAPGGASTLSWRVFGARALVLRDASGQDLATELPAEGQREVRPSRTTAYSLVATGEVGNEVRMATVEVVGSEEPRIAAFDVTPDRLPEGGGDARVSWATENADMVELRADGVRVEGFSGGASGMTSVTVAQTTRFELRAENGVGDTTETRIVEVGAADQTPPLLRHVPVPDGAPEGMPVEIIASATDAGSGVAGVTLFYRRRGETNFRTLALAADGQDRYRGTIPGSVALPPSIEYYLLATDAAPRANATVEPSGAPAAVHRFRVDPSDAAPPSITHTPVSAGRPEGGPLTVSAQVTDATGVARVALYYKGQRDALYTSVAMTESGGTYSGVIPGADVAPPGLDYYIEAADLRTPANVATEPSGAPGTVHAFSVTPRDSDPPAVAHTPITNGQQAGGAVTVSAAVTDATGVGTVELVYRTGTGSWTRIAMSGAGSSYVGQIPAASVQNPRVDYYFEVSDTASPPNSGRVPLGAPGTPYSFTVTPLDTAPPNISHTELYDGQPPGMVAVEAEVTDASGVGLVSLSYRVRGQANYSTANMSSAGGNTYRGSIPAASGAGIVEYFVEALDSAPAANYATLPSTAPSSPFDFAVATDEGEPNDTAATATPILRTVTQEIVTGAISSASDRDWFLVDIPSSAGRQTLRFEVTSGGPGRCPSGTDTRLRLYDSTGTQLLVEDDFDGVGSCSLLDPTTDAALRGVAPGRYHLSIEEDGTNAAISAYEIRASREPVQCGNRILESSVGEQCDDGNTTAGDGCSSTCRLEPIHVFTGMGGRRTGSISPAGDTELFAVRVDAGDNVTIEVSNGGTGCPGDAVLDLIRPDGITLAGTDDDDGPGACPRIDPLRDTFARALPVAGDWFIRVRGRSATGTVISSYTIDVEVRPNICGNRTVETGEQCDDGNASSHDGCSSTCQWETSGTASGMGASFTDSISPSGNVDWYQVMVPAGYAVRAETFAPSSPSCQTGNDTVLRFWQSDRSTRITTDDDGGTNLCSRLDPTSDAALRNLSAGTYFVSVEDYGNNSVISSYALDIGIEAPRCGDGFLGGSETCDDGNSTAGDGCSPTCRLEGRAETEPNDSRSQSEVLVASGQSSGVVFGTLGASDSDFYSLSVPANHHLLAQVQAQDGSCPIGTELRLYSSPTGFSRAFDDDDGTGDCPRLSPGLNDSTFSGVRALSAGTYYLEVREDSPRRGSGTPYRLEVEVLSPGCGDLYLDTGEQCDDGNTRNGDGCSSVCRFEASESEPNENASQATVLTSSTSAGTISGSITPSSDVDFYALDVAAGQSLEAAVHVGAIDQCRAGFDSEIELLDAMNRRVAFNDRGERYGTGSCSIVEYAAAASLTAGRYYIRVARNSGSNFDYALSWELR